jgi:hypothetical protein
MKKLYLLTLLSGLLILQTNAKIEEEIEKCTSCDEMARVIESGLEELAQVRFSIELTRRDLNSPEWRNIIDKVVTLLRSLEKEENNKKMLLDVLAELIMAEKSDKIDRGLSIHFVGADTLKALQSPESLDAA